MQNFAAKKREIRQYCDAIFRQYHEDVYDQLGQRALYEYFDSYLPELNDAFAEKHFLTPLNPKCPVNRAVFTLWLQGLDKASDLVRVCVKSLEKIGREVIVINERNIGDYIALPEYILQKYHDGIITRTKLSNVIRCYLLESYGGTWIDATVFIAGTVPHYMLDGLWFFHKHPKIKEIRSHCNWWISSSQFDTMIFMLRYAQDIYWRRENEEYIYQIFHVLWKKIIDTYRELRKKFYKIIPVYDSATGFLRQYRNRPFCAREWQAVSGISPVFKCSHKDAPGEGGTYYDMLLKGRL